MSLMGRRPKPPYGGMLAVQTADAKMWHPGCAPTGTVDEEGNVLNDDVTPIFPSDDWFADDSEQCAAVCGKRIARS